MPQSKTQLYQTTEILTADPGRLILLLYDGALAFLAQGKEKLREKDYDAKGCLLMKAHAIVSELLACLNQEEGGEIAQRLKAIYLYMLKRIMDADLHKQEEAIDEVRGHLTSLREAWQQILQRQATKVPVARPEAPTRITAQV